MIYLPEISVTYTVRCGIVWNVLILSLKAVIVNQRT